MRRVAAIAVLAAAGLNAWAFAQSSGGTRPSARTASAPAHASAPPAPGRIVPFKTGETLEYDVSWGESLTAGTATAEVRDKRPSFESVAYYIVAEGRPGFLLSQLYTLYYKADTLLDARTLLSQRGSIFSQEGTRRRMKEVRFDRRASTASVRVTTATERDTVVSVPAGTQDMLSALYDVRTLPLREGLTVQMPVMAATDQLYRVRITVSRREPITTPAGAFNAWRVVPALLHPGAEGQGQSFRLWISDDARRLPVKIEADMPVGRFVLTLRAIRGL